MARVFADLQRDAEQWLEHERVPSGNRSTRWQASLRYLHQGFELTVPWAGPEVTEAAVERTVAAFHALHERLYTFNQPDTPVEIVTLRVTAEGAMPRPAIPQLPKAGPPGDAVVGRQSVDFGHEARDTPIYDRASLGAGAEIKGPAILTQLDSTTVLFPGQTAHVHAYGSLVVRED
jgi:N-methylhydantoinase A